MLGDGDEAHPAGIKRLNDFGKVGQAAGEAVYLIYDDYVDPLSLDVRQQALKPRTLHRAAGKSAVIVVNITGPPPFLPLAEDVRLTGFTLRIERIEVLLQTLFAALAGSSPHN